MDNQQIFEEAINKPEYTLHKRDVTWSTDDLLSRAIEIEGENWSEVYDLSKFSEALDSIIDKHDANLGISWETIDFALNYYCRKDNKNE